jgi:uncharacterized protein (DUF2252 family)
VLEYYSVLDVAYWVSGVGRAGLRTCTILLAGDTATDYLFLQVKQAGGLVLTGRVDSPPSRYRHNGERIVLSMQRVQNVSDPLLGWTTMEGRNYYVRQLRDLQGAVPIEDLDATQLKVYGQM